MNSSRLLPWFGIVVAYASFTVSAAAQIQDQFLTFSGTQDFHRLIYRWNRKLEIESITDYTGFGGATNQLTPVAVDGTGGYWIPLDPLGPTTLMRLDRNGALLPSVVLAHNPVSLIISRDNFVYVPTRIPLTIPGPIYKVGLDGSIVWTNPQGPALYNFSYSPHIAIAPNGQIWTAGTYVGHCGCLFGNPRIARIDLGTGIAPDYKDLPPMGNPNMSDTFANGVFATLDDSIWTLRGANGPPVDPDNFVQTVGTSIVHELKFLGGWNGATNQIQFDANGNFVSVGTWSPPPLEFPGAIVRASSSDGSYLDVYEVGDAIGGFAHDPTGEVVYGTFANGVSPVDSVRVFRLNLVTGVKSFVHLLGLKSIQFPVGDSTGFVRANIVDRDGDADSDGYPNGAETTAGTHPYDPNSRPPGPKVYLSFATQNAIRLQYKDPDGLLHPTGGLDQSSLELNADGYGNILPLLWNFLSAASITPDGKEATITFGLLPITNDLKIGLEARVRDKTGATGWDWQVTPPGKK